MPDNSTNKGWLKAKLESGKSAYFLPQEESVTKKDSSGNEWLLQKGVVAHPPDVKGIPELPSFATTGVFGDKIGSARVESNDPKLVGAITGETIKTPTEGPVALGSIFGRKPPVSMETVFLCLGILVAAFVFIRLRPQNRV